MVTMKRILVSLFALLLVTSISAKVYSVSCPSGRLQMSISAGRGATTRVLAVDGETIMDSTRILSGKVATDYKLETLQVDSSSRMKVHMAPGGGFAMIICQK